MTEHSEDDRPTQPQPREEEARVEKCRCGFPFYEDRFTIPRLDGGSVPDAWEFCPYCGGRLDEPAQPQPRGEGDDLAARTVQIIRNRAKIAREQGTTEAQIIRARALDEAANEFADILPALRASTEGESARNFEEVVLDGDRFLVPAAVARALAPAHGEQEFDYEGEDGR